MTKKPVIQPQDKYVLRLPDGMRDKLKAEAEQNGRSMNAEIVARLEESFFDAVRIPPSLQRRMKDQAVLNGRTIPQEALETLEFLYPEPPSADELLSTLDEFVERVQKEDLFKDAWFKPRLMERLAEINRRLREK
ncbi:Arc family DNA-binding protein [Sinorhizobium meliloti]|uniref:Arc family DNA-binding protein n=1 Tax=Rhizobium meliloti TaxID=382 RepID=UPI00299CEC18|nr:Arc family DNA-binding protein [Sinorhizobium meliloti]MDW9872254.1 Arc family DNA-binding protein [Sinorhizobium meliloti]MDW9885438.1 Arc family DNA-binding protein [Sinorhizobium meliloti]MDX0207279.1 Arc family DNA-binding protein [Sinorhizobium meliloti]